MADPITEVAVAEVNKRAEFDIVARFTQDFVEVKIGDAVDYVLDECPTVTSRLRSGTLSINNYRRVVSEVVMRVLRNLPGVKSETELGYNIQLDPNVASGTFWLTDRDRRTLNGFQSKSRAPGTVSIGVDPGWRG